MLGWFGLVIDTIKSHEAIEMEREFGYVCLHEEFLVQPGEKAR